MFVNGMPYMSVWDGNGLERDNGKGGCKRMLEKARAMARAAGYKGIYFQAQCGYNPGEVKRMADFGFDETTTYHYIGTGGQIWHQLTASENWALPPASPEVNFP